MPSIINATTTNGVAVSGDNSGALALQTNNGTTAVTIDTSQNVGIGTTSPTDSASFTRALDVNGSGGAALYTRTNGSSTSWTAFGNFGVDGYINNRGAGTIQFYTNGNIERMRISSAGYVTVPFQPAFDMQDTTNSSSWRGGTVNVNTGNNWNNTTGTFTAPVAGRYLFIVSGQSSTSAYFYAGIRVNGVTRASFYSNETADYKHASCQLIVTLAVNDAVTAAILAASSPINVGGQNGFSGFFIG